MYDDILVPTDGQPGTNEAVARGLHVARTFDATVHALFALDAQLDSGLADDDRETVREQLTSKGRTATEEVSEWGADLDVDVVTEVREGVPEDTVCEYAAEHDCGLVVMGVQARETEDRHIGTTTQSVLVESPAPVVAVPSGDGGLPDPGYGAFDRVVVPTDGSNAAENAATHGLTIAERYGADVRVVYVVDSSTHELADTSRSILGPLREGGRNAVEDIAEEARNRNLPVSTAMLEGSPAEELLGYAEGAGTDLIAMGTHGSGATRQGLLGSTATRVLRQSTVPVLTVNEFR
jgi:Universal stress protein UspA and related nucleotide-binding proteins